jgi:hypothetical protein
MKEICIPFSHIDDDKLAEVEVRIPSTGDVWRYRIESINVQQTGKGSVINDEGINMLQQYIGSYNHNWELIQIVGLNEKTGTIQMLYREKSSRVLKR